MKTMLTVKTMRAKDVSNTRKAMKQIKTINKMQTLTMPRTLCTFTMTAALIAFSITPMISFAESQLIAMKTSQQEALGVSSQPLERVKEAWNTPYPAKIMVPNSQLRVVSAPLNGLLKSLSVAEGESVTKGQTLAVIHSPQLLEQQSAYLTALTDLNLAATEKKRNEQLSKEGIIAKRRFIESKASYTRAKTQLEQYRQSLKLSGMSNSALKTLRRTHTFSPTLTIKAPLSGVVLEQLATAGAHLNGLDPIYKIGHLKPLWLEVHVPLDQLGDVAKGTQVKIVDPEITGKVITVGRMVHGTDQGVLIRAEIKEGAAQLRPGQFVQAQIAQPRSEQSSYRIPRSAMVRNEDKTWVFVAKDEGFQPVAITVIKDEAKHLVISGKLQANIAIVVQGTAALKAAWLEGAE